MMIIKTVDDIIVEAADELPVLGQPYVFKEVDSKTDEWHFGEMWNHLPSEGGVNMLTLVNPKIIRKRVIRVL